MIVVNKKFKVIVITLLILLEVASTYLMYRSFNNRNVVLDNVKLKDASTKRSGLAIMIEQEDGTYKESSNNTWPEEMMYNEEKSGCIDDKGNAIDGALTYEGGVANIRTKSSSYCFLYFDLIKDDVTIAISTDGESGVMPSSGSYTNSATCSSGNITWSDKYQRIELGDLTKPIKCNVRFTKDTSTKTLLKDEVENKATTISLTNNSGTTETSNRYTGKTPDNWIWFNNEMWRIIGSIPVCLNSSCSSKENLIKIIRSESIGGLALDGKDSGYTSLWGNNTLYDLLNNYYYGKKDATGASPCYGYSTYYGVCNYTQNGISNSVTDYYGKMIKSVYWNIGTTSATVIYASYKSETATISTISGKIGLMNASDYGYATSGITDNVTTLEKLSSYVGGNWLYSQGYEWTITPYNSGLALTISNAGHIESYNAAQGNATRPVVYLDSAVYIVSGDGSKTNPYMIGV